jgi:hypothetical protein
MRLELGAQRWPWSLAATVNTIASRIRRMGNSVAILAGV